MGTRQRIVETADRLFYEHGYDHTSFADIASAVHISRGNFYYHFKSKDDILHAVLEFRVSNTRAMLESWESEVAEPAERIRRFIEILVENRAKIEQFGCPVGTMATELAKLGHGAQASANALFELFHVWLERQLRALGLADEASDLAMHLLARSQGAAVLANAFPDRSFIEREVAMMIEWLESCTTRDQN